MKVLAIVLLAAGVLALIYGGFSYSRETHEAKLGPVEVSIAEKKQVNVPIWAGVALVVAGGGLLLIGKEK
jgi:hypothetical protein